VTSDDVELTAQDVEDAKQWLGALSAEALALVLELLAAEVLAGASRSRLRLAQPTTGE
jgi:hypothetical protein